MGKPDKGIGPVSRSGRVFSEIRTGILSGRYREGEELKEEALGGELGVSRTPVREALRQLEQEGLIDIIPNKGAVVTGVSPDDIRDIYMVRARLDGLAASLAAGNIDEKGLEELEENVHLAEYHCERGNVDRLPELDSRFHEIIYRAGGSRYIGRMMVRLHQYSFAMRQKTLAKVSRAEASNREHRLITEALKKRDPSLADRLSREHVIKAYENMLEKGYVNGGRIE